MNNLKNDIESDFVAGKQRFYPANKMARNWQFQEGEEDLAKLCNAMADILDANGMNANDLMNIFPLVLRMLKVNSQWSK